MRRGIFASGLVGLAIGVVVILAAAWAASRIPSLNLGPSLVTLGFALLVLAALAEIPIMVFSLRQMVRSASVPLSVVLVLNAAYTAFASVYGAIYMLLTREMMGGLAIASLGILRVASGAWVK